MTDDFYWNLTLKDGRVIPIPPQAVDAINNKLKNRQQIVTTEFTVPFWEVKSFDRTSRRKEQASLLEDDPVLQEEVARAFNEPIVTQDENGRDMVKAAWIKKEVTSQEWANHAKSGSYKHLERTQNGMVWMAFTMPLHQIKPNIHIKCTQEEIRQLSHY